MSLAKLLPAAELVALGALVVGLALGAGVAALIVGAIGGVR